MSFGCFSADKRHLFQLPKEFSDRRDRCLRVSRRLTSFSTGQVSVRVRFKTSGTIAGIQKGYRLRSARLPPARSSSGVHGFHPPCTQSKAPLSRSLYPPKLPRLKCRYSPEPRQFRIAGGCPGRYESGEQHRFSLQPETDHPQRSSAISESVISFTLSHQAQLIFSTTSRIRAVSGFSSIPTSSIWGCGTGTAFWAPAPR